MLLYALILRDFSSFLAEILCPDGLILLRLAWLQMSVTFEIIECCETVMSTDDFCVTSDTVLTALLVQKFQEMIFFDLFKMPLIFTVFTEL